MLTTEARSGHHAMVNSQPAPHNAVAAAWLATHSSPNTRGAYRTDLNLFGRWCAGAGAIALRADTETLLAFHAARRAAGDSPATLRRRWSALTSFYEFAVASSAAPLNPATAATRPPIPDTEPNVPTHLSAREVAEYRALAASLDPRLEAIVALLVADGLKVGEALALDIEHVSGKPPRTSIVVRRRGVAQRVVLDPESAHAVMRCAGRRRSGPLFTSSRAGTGGTARLTRFGADHLIRQLTNGTDTRITASALRRFHIVSHRRSGADIDEVRERAGLADARSVRRYTT